MTRGRLICLAGIDGSGKTTLAQSLPGWLADRGLTYRYVYARFLPFFVRPVWATAKIVFLSSAERRQSYGPYTARKRSLLSADFFSRLHEISILADYWFQILFKVAVPLWRGRNLVCDRYVYDTVVSDLAPDLLYSRDRIQQVVNRCLTVMPKPDLVFLLDVPEEVTLSRKTDVADIEYLKERREIYRSLALREKAVPLAGTLSKQQILEQAGETIMSWLEKPG
jgi:thymidylate kinase